MKNKRPRRVTESYGGAKAKAGNKLGVYVSSASFCANRDAALEGGWVDGWVGGWVGRWVGGWSCEPRPRVRVDGVKNS